MRVTTSWMAQKYAEFNEKYFAGTLPTNISFVTNMERSWGRAQAAWKRVWTGWGYNVEGFEYKIFMSNQYDSPENVRENTMLHEMIHIADYMLHPEHFVTYWNGKWHKVRGYDAHGPIFFGKLANKFREYGFDIQRYVSEEEKSVSQLGDEMLRRAAKGYVIGFLICDPDSYQVIGSGKPNLMFKVASKSVIPDLVESVKEINECAGKWYHTFKKMIIAQTDSPDFVTMPVCRKRITGNFKSDEDMENIINRNNLQMETVWEVAREPAVHGMVRENTEMGGNEPIDGENGVYLRATKNRVDYTMV